MNLIFKIISIIYRTYDDRGLDIPHFRVIVTVVFFFFLNIVSIGLLFDIPLKYIIPWSSQDDKGLQWLKASLYFVLPILLIAAVFSRKKLEKVPVTYEQIHKGKKILHVYMTLSIVLLMTLLLIHGINKRTIKF